MKLLCQSTLPEFKPRKDVVFASNGPMKTLRWAFSCSCPPSARLLFSEVGGASNESLQMHATPAMQWMYSMMHLAYHYDDGHRKFMITTEDRTDTILLEVTSLWACPNDIEDMNALPQSNFMDPQDKDSLGAIPLFFVRFLRFVGKNAPREAMKFNGGVMGITVASKEELCFGFEELKRCQTFLDQKFNALKFNSSVLFPIHITEVKSYGKSPYVCASCNAVITVRPAPICSKCKMTFYCNRECQVKHWKHGGHKQICGKTQSKPGHELRKSLVFNIEDAKHPAEFMTSVNYQTGSMRTTGLNKQQRSELNTDHTWSKVGKIPGAKNVYGDKEFIVKLQPPAGSVGLPALPWMCYDGPARSFQAYIPSETSGLQQVYTLLQSEGVKSVNPMLGVPGYKGYFKARWEGDSLRVFYDKIVDPQLW